jgi:hypothetical protein
VTYEITQIHVWTCDLCGHKSNEQNDFRVIQRQYDITACDYKKYRERHGNTALSPSIYNTGTSSTVTMWSCHVCESCTAMRPVSEVLAAFDNFLDGKCLLDLALVHATF